MAITPEKINPKGSSLSLIADKAQDKTLILNQQPRQNRTILALFLNGRAAI
jgi:hypothetical protein